MSAMTASYPNKLPADKDDFLGHPKGLYVCFFTEMWERFSFYGMKALLFLYLVKYHLLTDEHGYNLLGSYGALVYAMPIIGGLLADRYLGMRKAVVFGAILLVLGHAGMAYEGAKASLLDGEVVRDDNALQIFYFSLALIIMGVGFLKPSISTIVGKLYPENDPRRDSGFTIFYAGINLGAFIAPIICAYLGETYGWKYGFGLAGIGMVGGLLVFIFGQKYLGEHGKSPIPERLRQKTAGLSFERWIYLFAVAGLFIIWGLIQSHSVIVHVVNWLPSTSPVALFLNLVAIIYFLGIVWFITTHCSAIERHQMIVLHVFILASLIFYSLAEQTYSSWIAMSDRVMDRTLIGIEWSAGQLTALGALFILILSPVFAWLWPFLDKIKLNPSKPTKMGIGFLFTSLSFLVLVLAMQSSAEGSLVSAWFLVSAYLMLELGELSIAPICLSAVTQLSVKRVVSLMMGALFLGISYAEILAATLSKIAAIKTDSGRVTDIAFALSKYEELFILAAQIGLAAAVVYFAASPFLKKMMHGIK